MRLKTLLLLLPVFLLALSTPVYAAPAWSVSLTDKAIGYLAVSSRDINTVWAAGNDSGQSVYVYKSGNGGLSWTAGGGIAAPFTVFSFASAFTHPDSLMIGGWNPASRSGALFKSDDGGASWTNLSDRVGNQAVQGVNFGTDTEQTLLVGTDQQLWVSYDGGKTFAADNNNPCWAMNIHDIAVENQNPGTAWFSLDSLTCGGVSVTPDSGRTIATASYGLPGSPNQSASVFKIAIDNASNQGVGLASVAGSAGTVNPSVLWRTPNRGANWWQVGPTDAIQSIGWDPANDQNVYYTSTTGLYVSHDQGNRFDYISEAGTGGAVAVLSNPARLITSGSRGIAVFDLTSGPIPVKVPVISNPAPLPGAPAAATAAPAGNGSPAQTPAGAGQSFTFPQTGHTVSGIWLDYVKSHGDVDLVGYPRTEVIVDPLTGLTVQYFQRFVLEWHPEINQIQRRLLTDTIHPGLDPPIPNPSPLVRLFPQTDHTVSDNAPNGDYTGFRTFFEGHGSESTFAYPLEEPKLVNGHWTQRFQAAVMEAHPENPAPYKVQLELLGDEYIQMKGLGFK